MLVTDALLIDTDPLNTQSSVTFTEPVSVELIVRDEEEEHYSHCHCQVASDRKDNLPRRNRRTVQSDALGNSISNQPIEDLRKAIEAEPDAHSCSLLLLSVPVVGEESEAWRHSSFEDSKKEAHGDCVREVGNGCHGAVDEIPDYDAEG